MRTNGRDFPPMNPPPPPLPSPTLPKVPYHLHLLSVISISSNLQIVNPLRSNQYPSSKCRNNNKNNNNGGLNLRAYLSLLVSENLQVVTSLAARQK